MAYDGRLREGHVDVFSGPAVQAAVEHAKSIGPGQFAVTAFSAWDGPGLAGVDGRSLIVRLPESCPQNNRPYVGEQWYLSGKPSGPLRYTPTYIDAYVEPTRCWLMDLAVLKNYFAARPDREVVLFRRLKSLDTGHFMSSGGMKLIPPKEYQDNSDHYFIFHVELRGEVNVGEDLPVALWYAHEKGSRVVPGVLDRACQAPFACVFYARFQACDPENAE